LINLEDALLSDPTPIFTRTFDFLTWLLPATIEQREKPA